MFKRKIILLLIIMGGIFLSACSRKPLGQSLTGLFSNDEAKADTQFEKVIDALKNNDKEALKANFSKQALSEVQDIDDQIGCLFDYIQGTMESWYREGWSSSGDTQDGKKSVMGRPNYIVKTDVTKYIFNVITYTKDTFNPDNVGIYILRVIEEKDAERYREPWIDWIVGIWIPEEEEIEDETLPNEQ